MFGTYNIGDLIEFEDFIPGGNVGTGCSTSGTQDSYTEGRTATTNGTTTVILSASSDVLRKGDYVTINSVDVRIESISGTTMIVSATIGAASGQAITYNNAVFKNYGAIAA